MTRDELSKKAWFRIVAQIWDPVRRQTEKEVRRRIRVGGVHPQLNSLSIRVANPVWSQAREEHDDC
jgi:hypothetical protein